MQNILLTLTFGALATGSAVASSCSTIDLPIQWVINPTHLDGNSSVQSAIQADGSLPYVNGQSGTQAVIHVCSGSGDATMNPGSSRSVSISFSRRLASNSNTPSFALQGSTITGQPFMNVRNLLFVPSGFDRSMEFTFSTRFNTSVPTSGTWGFHFIPNTVDAPSTAPNAAIANSPYPDSPAHVHHCPANTNTSTCPGVVNETWFVWSDAIPSGTSQQTGLPLTQVGTLLNQQKSTPVNAGEFSMPFSFTISLLH